MLWVLLTLSVVMFIVRQRKRTMFWKHFFITFIPIDAHWCGLMQVDANRSPSMIDATNDLVNMIEATKLLFYMTKKRIPINVAYVGPTCIEMHITISQRTMHCAMVCMCPCDARVSHLPCIPHSYILTRQKKRNLSLTHFANPKPHPPTLSTS